METYCLPSSSDRNRMFDAKCVLGWDKKVRATELFSNAIQASSENTRTTRSNEHDNIIIISTYTTGE